MLNLDVAADAQIDPDWQQRFNMAMNDDFNTPEALAVLFELTHEINRLRTDNQPQLLDSLVATLKHLGAILGIMQQDPQTFLQQDVNETMVAEIEKLIADRKQARADKDWAAADRIRDQLQEQGIELADGEGGTTWRKI